MLSYWPNIAHPDGSVEILSRNESDVLRLLDAVDNATEYIEIVAMANLGMRLFIPMLSPPVPDISTEERRQYILRRLERCRHEDLCQIAFGGKDYVKLGGHPWGTDI